ncbi:unnamed protein product [Mytilus edulis]|uniref:Uncharacterized protein n=1 Tax=Mytilus edulis TaxID=6550 RepID=A0A8S3TAR9_MYTED|nr:unnamed protein product [Mytilus edulis]
MSEFNLTGETETPQNITADSDTETYDELVALLPSVIQALKDSNKLEEFKCFHCSNVNFIVPDRRSLEVDEKFIVEDKPGVITKMIKKIAIIDSNQAGTYKVCVDGKKINPSSKGEVNLWGAEDKPTFEEKQNRLEKEVELCERLKEKRENSSMLIV